MSATFNWAYRPGVSNKYGITIDPSADNVKPDNAVYVALFGNDVTGNGSRQYPLKTIQAATTRYGGSGLYMILGSGTYREQITSGTIDFKIVGDGDVTIDCSYFGVFNNNSTIGASYNVNWIGSGDSMVRSSSSGVTVDSTTDGLYFGINDQNYKSGNVYKNITQPFHLFGDTSGRIFSADTCTFYNCQGIEIWQDGNYAVGCIFYKCNISAFQLKFMALMQYCLFYECNFKITDGWGNETPNYNPTYPDEPDGFTNFTDIDSLRAAMMAYDAAIVNPLRGCVITDPKFNNPAIGDFTLTFDSPAKNLSYLGTFVGAKSIAQKMNVSATESDGEFEFESAINVTINDDSITFTDPTADAQIDTKVIVNIIGREISRLSSYGFNADRNGQYIDSIPDLSSSIYLPGNALPAMMPFIVEAGAITYNGDIYQPGDRATTISGAGAFSTSEGGVIREILEAPERHTIMVRFSNGGDTVTTGDALTDGNYYYVVSGAVSYNGIDQGVGTVFKAGGTDPFTGAGKVITAFSTESFQHYEPGIKPTSNNVGDSRTGAIIRGNGDPAYIRGGLGIQEFPINQKFIQVRYYIRANNLKL